MPEESNNPGLGNASSEPGAEISRKYAGLTLVEWRLNLGNPTIWRMRVASWQEQPLPLEGGYTLYTFVFIRVHRFFFKVFCRAGRNVSVCLISMHFTDGGTELARPGCFFFEKMKVFALASDGCVKAFPTLSTSHFILRVWASHSPRSGMKCGLLKRFSQRDEG